MTQFLPPNLLALFAPREPIPYLPPSSKLPTEKKNVHEYHGIGALISDHRVQWERPEDTPIPPKVEMRNERLERKHKEKEEQVAYKLEQEIALWDPNSRENSTQDPFKTLFVARINYDTSQSKLRREFEQFGSIKSIHLVQDSNTGKPRGYAFIEYEHERDMHSAYKHADGMKMDGRRVLVDVERSRTVKGWLPRRLGGGLGGTRRGGADVNVRHSGREDGGGRRSRSRERGTDVGGFGAGSRRRSRSRERKRGRRSRSKERSRRSRSRSRSREKKRSKRSRSKDRKRSKRSRSKSRDRSKRKDRSSRRERGDDGLGVKDEPNTEGGEYGYDGMDIKREEQQGSEGGGGDYDEYERKPLNSNNGDGGSYTY